MDIAALLSIAQRRCRRALFALVFLVEGWNAIAHAQTFTVSGTVHNLNGSGLQLRLATSATCLNDNESFTLHSTDLNDCFLPANYNKCCSQSIKQTASDGISTVTCTCGVIIPGSVSATVDSANTPLATQTITVPLHATSFTFPTAVADISNYTVSVAHQPVSPVLICSTTAGFGVINGHNITAPVVTCIDRIFKNGFDPGAG